MATQGNSNVLFAQASELSAQTAAEHTATEQTTAHGEAPKAGESGEKGGFNFNQLIDHLADSHSLEFHPFGEVSLPYMFWDQDGFHAFSGEKSLEESGVYKTVAFGGPARKDGKPLSFDLSITANVVFLLLAAVVLLLVGLRAAKQAKKSLVPRGVGNLLESLVVFVRDEIVRPNVEQPFADNLMPFFLTVFFFILLVNFLGLLPFGRSATGSVWVTAALAISTFFVTQYIGIKAMGIKSFLMHLTGGIPEMELNLPLKIVLTIIMIPIEFLGLFTKPFALAVRLFANMTAGHIVIVSLIGIAFLMKSVVIGTFVSVPFALFINLLEILVALIQAYVFTMLSAIFIGMMAHSHHEEHVHDHDQPHPMPGEHLVATSHTV